METQIQGWSGREATGGRFHLYTFPFPPTHSKFIIEISMQKGKNVSEVVQTRLNH